MTGEQETAVVDVLSGTSLAENDIGAILARLRARAPETPEAFATAVGALAAAVLGRRVDRATRRAALNEALLRAELAEPSTIEH